MSTIKYSLPLRNFYGGHHYISCIKILTVTEQHLLNVCMCASAIIFEKVERRDSIHFVFVEKKENLLSRLTYRSDNQIYCYKNVII